MSSFHLAMERCDLFMVADASDESVTGLAVVVGSQGNVRTEALKAFPSEVADSIISRLP